MTAGLRVCLLAPDLFARGRYSGAGRTARLIGRELACRGVRVTAVIPRPHGQRDVEHVDGITVLGYSPDAPWQAIELYRQANADIYHSEAPHLATALAAIARPRRAHVVTVRTPYALREVADELRGSGPGRARSLARRLADENPLVWLAVHRARAIFSAAEDLVPIVRAKYRRAMVEFLPSPVEVPRRVQKGRAPAVCFLGGWERWCHPETFFELVRRFPSVAFIAVGQSRDRAYDAELRRTYGHLPNIRFTGFINQFRSDALSQFLSESWVLVHTGSRAGLPDACVEAAAHRCAILSATDPDGFASRFGHHAADGDLAAGLDTLLAGAWRERGECGAAHVRATFELGRVADRRIALYEALTGRGTGATQPEPPRPADAPDRDSSRSPFPASCLLASFLCDGGAAAHRLAAERVPLNLIRLVPA